MDKKESSSLDLADIESIDSAIERIEAFKRTHKEILDMKDLLVMEATDAVRARDERFLPEEDRCVIEHELTAEKEEEFDLISQDSKKITDLFYMAFRKAREGEDLTDIESYILRPEIVKKLIIVSGSDTYGYEEWYGYIFMGKDMPGGDAGVKYFEGRGISSLMDTLFLREIRDFGAFRRKISYLMEVLSRDEDTFIEKIVEATGLSVDDVKKHVESLEVMKSLGEIIYRLDSPEEIRKSARERMMSCVGLETLKKTYG